jgi:F1F0 ATPase subunit 2
MTDSALRLLGVFLAGAALGGIFFGGLWLTIRYALSSAAIGLWLMGSFMVRTAIVVAGFYLVFAGDWRRLTACLLGFALARFIVARLLKPSAKPQTAAGAEASHAN